MCVSLSVSVSVSVCVCVRITLGVTATGTKPQPKQVDVQGRKRLGRGVLKTGEPEKGTNGCLLLVSFEHTCTCGSVVSSKTGPTPGLKQPAAGPLGVQQPALAELGSNFRRSMVQNDPK